MKCGMNENVEFFLMEFVNRESDFYFRIEKVVERG